MSRRTTNGERAQLQELKLLLRYAASELSEIERKAAEGFAYDIPQRAIATEVIGFRRGAIYYAQHRAFRKMRARMERLGIRSVSDIL